MNNLEIGNNNVEEILKSFAEDNNLMHFLEKYEIAKLSEIIYKKYYQKDDHRCVMIADTMEENFRHRTRILIDLRLGSPTVNQVYDSLYRTFDTPVDGFSCNLFLPLRFNKYFRVDSHSL